MTAPLKTFFSPSLVCRLAADILNAYPSFQEGAFIDRACDGLERLELMERARHIARSLADHLPETYPDALRVLLASLGPEHSSDELVGVGMAPFYYLPHLIFVAEYGLDHFDLSMQAQYELTKRFSAEFSIRAYLAKYPERAMAVLHEWIGDPNPHVRRLVSEGTRLRLPWASRVSWLDQNPEQVLELLERLKDDPTSLVRRSVANNLNDLGKVRPDLLIRTCSAWMGDPSPDRRKLVEHALRSAVKRGQPDALRILGYGKKAAVSLEWVRFEPESVEIGESIRISFALRNESKTPQDILVDLAVHFVKAHGNTAPKVFKVKRLSLPPAGWVEIQKTVSLAIHSTRTPRPGAHLVDILVNGEVMSAGSFDVVSAHP